MSELLELIIRVKVEAKQLMEKDNEVLEASDGEVDLDQLIETNIREAMGFCELTPKEIKIRVHKTIPLSKGHLSSG